jgi:hypothetical protein
VELHAFLSSAQDGSEEIAKRIGRFNTEEIKPDTHMMGGCGHLVGSRDGLDLVERWKILPCLYIEAGSSSLYSVTLLNELPGSIYRSWRRLLNYALVIK